MVILKLEGLSEYAAYMKKHPDEGEKLYDDILDTRHQLLPGRRGVRALKNEVYPAIVKD